MLRQRRMLAVVAAIAATTLSIGVVPTDAQAADVSTPPFTQCPAIGASPSCEILLVVNADGTVSVVGDPSVGTFDSDDDTLVGIVNNSTSAVNAVTVSGPNTGLAGFDGDGICSGAYGTWNGSAGCSYGPTGYEGPGTSFVTNDALPDSVEVDFAGGLKPGGTAFFSLEGALTSAELTSREGGLCSKGGSFRTEVDRHLIADEDQRTIYNYKTNVAWCLSDDGQVLLEPTVQDSQSATVVQRWLLISYLQDQFGFSQVADISHETITVTGNTCVFSGVKFVDSIDLLKPIEFVASSLITSRIKFIRVALEKGGAPALAVLKTVWNGLAASLPTYVMKLANRLPTPIRNWIRDKILDKVKEVLLDADEDALTEYVLSHLSAGNASAAEIIETVENAIKTIESALTFPTTDWAPTVAVTINGKDQPASVVDTGPVAIFLSVVKDPPQQFGPFQ